MINLTENQKLGLYCGAFCALLVLFSYLSGLLLYAYTGVDTSTVTPFSVFEFINDPYFYKRARISLIIPYAVLLAGVIWFYATQDRHLEKQIGGNRFATKADLERAQLLNIPVGLTFGIFKNRYLRSNADTHALVVAPTRSGKGVGLVIPNLLSWRGSVVCLDVKQENFEKTAGYRKSMGNEIYLFAPLSPHHHSHCYNPLDAISTDPTRRMSDIQDMAMILIPNPTHADKFWASEARALFVGLVSYVLIAPNLPKTLGTVMRLLGTKNDLGDLCAHIAEKHQKDLSSGAQKALLSFANKAEKERSGVKSTLDEALYLWTDPVIDAATSKSDFSLADLRKKKMSIYLGAPTGALEKLAPLLRIFFEQTTNILSMNPASNAEPHKVLMMIDEFHMLGKMTAIKKGFTLMAGYGLRIMAVVQSLTWLDHVYGRTEAEGIIAGCAHQIFFAPNDNRTAEYISKRCGEKIVETTTISHRKSWKYEPPSKSTGRANRPLISIGDIHQLSPKEQVIIVEGQMPVRAEKIVYYNDKNFSTRILPAPVIPALKIEEHGIPRFEIHKKLPQGKKEDEMTDNAFLQSLVREEILTGNQLDMS